jgi:hypothetical protein
LSTLPTPAIFRNLHGKVDPGVVSAIHLIFNATKDAHDAIVALSGQHGTTVQNVSNVTTQIGSLTTIINNVAEAVPEGNVNQQTVPYAIQNSDYGGVVILQGAGPYDITLNSAVTMPYYTICFNLGSVSATVTPDLAGATVNNVASLTLGVNQWMLIFFDGLNWWALYTRSPNPTFENLSSLVNGVTTVFTLANTYSVAIVVSDGFTLIPTVGFTLVGTTLTMTDPPVTSLGVWGWS